MQQFLDKSSWQDHIAKEHPADSMDCKALTCPHPRCSQTSFETTEDRDFHFHDVHCWEPKKPRAGVKAGVKRRRSCLEEKDEEDAEESEEKPPKRRRVRTVARPGTFKFVDQSDLFGKFDFLFFFSDSDSYISFSGQCFSVLDVSNVCDGYLSSRTLR